MGSSAEQVRFIAPVARRGCDEPRSIADTGNEALLLGRRQARHAANSAHPFGFGPERYFWSFVVAVMLFTVGSVFSLLEGIDKIRAPEPLSSPAWAVGVIVAAMVLEGLSLRTAARGSTRSSNASAPDCRRPGRCSRSRHRATPPRRTATREQT